MASIAELLLTACVLPTIFTFALFRAGLTSSIDLRDRTDRTLPSAATAFCCLLGWVVLRVSAAPPDISNLAIAVAAQMAALALLTTR
jgi:hypothetical protein